MKLVRLALGLGLVGPMLGAASPASAASPCEPRTVATYRYSSTDLTFGFALRTCDPVTTMPFEIDATREDASGHGVGVFVLGVADCANRVCTARLSFPHGPEVARYRGIVYWSDVASDEIGWIYCATTPSVTGCRPEP